MSAMTKAGIEMLIDHLDYFRKKPVNIPKITIKLDHGYHPDKITAALQLVYPQIMTKIRFQLALKPTKAEKAAQGKTGFVPIATRWIIERSNAWMERCKSLVKNEEAHLRSCHCQDRSLLYPIDAEALSQGIRAQMGSIDISGDRYVCTGKLKYVDRESAPRCNSPDDPEVPRNSEIV